MNYRITIERTVENPNYKEELKRFNGRMQYGYGQEPAPISHTTENALYCVLNEEQFNEVRKAVFASFK